MYYTTSTKKNTHTSIILLPYLTKNTRATSRQYLHNYTCRDPSLIRQSHYYNQDLLRPSERGPLPRGISGKYIPTYSRILTPIFLGFGEKEWLNGNVIVCLTSQKGRMFFSSQ